MTKIDIKPFLKSITDKKLLALLTKQSDRVLHAILSLILWHNNEGEKFPSLVTGSSGSSKSFITVELFKALLGAENVCHIVPPSDGSYNDFIHGQITGKHYRMIIIDEAHKLDFDIETIQPFKRSLTIGETSINYGNLIFISHSGLGKNASEDARLNKVEFGTPSREEIIELLIKFEGYGKEKANWSAWHAPRNIHNAKSVSDKFGTALQDTVLPCGLLGQDLSVLRYYLETGKVGSNTISSCSGKLCLDRKAVEQSERRLKGEGFLTVGKQSRRDVSELGADLIYTLEENSNPETEKPAQSKPKSNAKKSPNKSKPKSKAKPQSKSKPAQSKPKSAKSPSSKGKAKKVSLDDIKSEIVVNASPLDSYPSTKD